MRFPKAVRRFLLGYLVLHMLAVGIFVLILTRITRNQMVHDARTRMSTITTMMADYVDQLDDGLNNAALPAALKRLGIIPMFDLRWSMIREWSLPIRKLALWTLVRTILARKCCWPRNTVAGFRSGTVPRSTNR